MFFLVKLLEFSTKKIARQEAQAETECLKASYFLSGRSALAELWVSHLLRVLFERNRYRPVAATDALVNCTPVRFVSNHILTATLLPATTCGVLLVHLPKEENDEGDKKGAGTNEHNVHRSLLSEEKLSSK